mgnify:FL=1
MQNKIKAFLERISQKSIKDENQDLISAGFLDSFSMIELIVFLESEFGVEVNMESLNRDNFNSLNHLVESLKKWKKSD